GRAHIGDHRKAVENSGDSFRLSVLSILQGGSANSPVDSDAGQHSAARQVVAAHSGVVREGGLRLVPPTSAESRRSVPPATPGPPSFAPAAPSAPPPAQPAASTNPSPVLKLANGRPVTNEYEAY